MHLICNVIGVTWAMEMGKHWSSSGRAWHLWFLGIDFKCGWVISPRLLTGDDACSWLPILDFAEWLSGWLGGLLSNTQQGFFKWYFHTRGIATTQNGLWSWLVQKNYWMSVSGSVLRPGATAMNWTELVLCSLGGGVGRWTANMEAKINKDKQIRLERGVDAGRPSRGFWCSPDLSNAVWSEVKPGEMGSSSIVWRRIRTCQVLPLLWFGV